MRTPLPATADNVIAGALWTALIFPVATAGFLAAVSGWSSYSPFVFLAVLVVSAFVELLLIPGLGVPLALLASRLLRGVPSVRWHLLAQFVAGGLAGAIVVVGFLVLTGSLPEPEYAEGLTFSVIGLAIVTGLASMTGWYLSLRRYRRPPKPDPGGGDPYGTADEDFD